MIPDPLIDLYYVITLCCLILKIENELLKTTKRFS